MNNDKLLEYLVSSKEELEANEHAGTKVLNYLYFATQLERMYIHGVEESHRVPIGSSLIQKNQRDLLEFRPYFDDALTRKGITSLATCRFPESFDARAGQGTRDNFIREVKEIEASFGILNALLHIRNWAFFPEKEKGSKNRSRLAQCYLGVVLSYLHGHLNDDLEISQFLDWCGKRTRKVFPWGFKESTLRSPSKGALPIYKDEAADYVEHFLSIACNTESPPRQDCAEMVIFLALCLTCARQYSNCIRPADILRITKEDIVEVSAKVKTEYFDSVQDKREASKSTKGDSAHAALLLNTSPDFLQDQKLWPAHPPTSQTESKSMCPPCKAIKVKGRQVLISRRLAQALEIMGKFTITTKIVEKRLKEAYETIGLSQSSGGVAPSCFLCRPHHWQGVDVRKKPI
jgi:hypothetical protein